MENHYIFMEEAIKEAKKGLKEGWNSNWGHFSSR